MRREAVEIEARIRKIEGEASLGTEVEEESPPESHPGQRSWWPWCVCYPSPRI